MACKSWRALEGLESKEHACQELIPHPQKLTGVSRYYGNIVNIPICPITPQ